MVQKYEQSCQDLHFIFFDLKALTTFEEVMAEKLHV